MIAHNQNQRPPKSVAPLHTSTQGPKTPQTPDRNVPVATEAIPQSLSAGKERRKELEEADDDGMSPNNASTVAPREKVRHVK